MCQSGSLFCIQYILFSTVWEAYKVSSLQLSTS